MVRRRNLDNNILELFLDLIFETEEARKDIVYSFYNSFSTK